MPKLSMPRYKEQLSRQLYNLLLWLLLPFALGRLYWKSRTNPAYRSRILERFAIGLPKLNGCILVHAVSVGETVAALPFVEKLLLEFPSRDILLTSTTPTGFERVTTLFKGQVEQCFLPFDTNRFASKLLKQTRPAVVVVIETEIWPNLIYQCHRRKIPVLLANARLSERSFHGYKKFAWLLSPTLRKISVIAAHAKPDQQRFLTLGADQTRTHTIGSIKFDLRLPAALDQEKRELLNTLQHKPFIWVAASTHEGEEELIIKCVQKIRAACPHSLCILVPRHQERFESVARLLNEQGMDFKRFSLDRTLPENTSILLGDTMGQLMLFYAIADAAFVGGSLTPIGGHNVLESLACKTATIVGPHMFNFQTIHDLLMADKAIIEIQDWEQLADQLLRLSNNHLLRNRIAERGEAVVQANRGALDRLVSITHRLADSGALDSSRS